MRISLSAMAGALLLVAGSASATTITFEGYAPSGDLTNVSPAAPYTESGFTFTPLNDQAAVFGTPGPATFFGDSTDWFGFADGNTITLTGPTPFALTQLLAGPTSYGTGTTDLTITGYFVGGGSTTGTWTGLTTAMTFVLNWSNLASVTFDASTDSGLDDIMLDPPPSVPEPLSLSLLAGGLAGIGALRRRKKSA